MPEKSGWTPYVPGASSPRDPERQAGTRRTLLMVAVAGFVADLAVAGWFLLGPVDMPDRMRYLVAGAIVLGGVVGLVLLGRVARERLDV